MKIAMVGPFPSGPEAVFGGVAGASKYLADELAKLPGVSLTVVVPQGSETGKPVVEQWRHLRVHRLGRTGALRFLPATAYDVIRGADELQSCLAGLEPDVVHFQGLAFLAARCRFPSLLTIHGFAEKDAAWDRRSAPLRGLKRLLLGATEGWGRRRARNVVLISRAASAALPPDSKRRTWSIPNPVARGFFDVERRPQPGRVFSSSRLIPLKNVTGLIEAFARAAAGLPDATLRLGGTGDRDYEKACRQKAEALGVAGRVRFLGGLSVRRVQEELSRCACFALASVQENAPLSIAEAMAAGVPVAATRVGGVPELVEDGATGRLAEAGDSDGLARALRSMLTRPGEAAAFGAAAKEKARERHEASRVAARLLAVYRELAEARA